MPTDNPTTDGTMTEARGVVVKGPNEPVQVETIVVPDPGPGEVVVDVAACGVCHTDLHYVEGGISDEFPFLLGHEAAGTVSASRTRRHRGRHRRLRGAQLACRLRAVPRMRPRTSPVLLRHPQRDPDDDPGRRHRAVSRPRHRCLRREDPGRRRPVHQGRPGGPTGGGRTARLRRHGRTRRRHQHRLGEPRRQRGGHRLWRRRRGRCRRCSTGRCTHDHRRGHRRPEAGGRPALRCHPHGQLLRPTPWRPSGSSPAATAPTWSSTPWGSRPPTSRPSTPGTSRVPSCWSASRARRCAWTFRCWTCSAGAARSSPRGTATACPAGTSRC